MALDSAYNYNYSDYDYISIACGYENSEISFDVKSAFRLFYVVCYTLIFCISVPGNGFLLWVLLRERAWKTTSDILLLQVIISDLCLAVTLSVFACCLHQDWFFEDWVSGLIRGAYFLGVNSYVLILTAMTLYRYVAVVHPSCLSAQTLQKFSVLAASIVIWLVSAAASIKVSVSFTTQPFDICMLFGLFFLIPFIIITFCYVHMCTTIKQCRIDRHHQASRLILGMIVVFYLCMVPFNIMLFRDSLLLISILGETLEWTTAVFYAHIIYMLPNLHCCLNPLLHIFGAQRFRRHLLVPCNTSSQGGDEGQNLTSMAVVPPHDASV